MFLKMWREYLKEEERESENTQRENIRFKKKRDYLLFRRVRTAMRCIEKKKEHVLFGREDA